MKTITKDKVSLYTFADDAVLNVSATWIEVVGQFTIGDLNSSNAVIHEGVTPPADWEAGKYLYDGSWTVDPKHIEKVKRTGIEILGVMCSATKEDQNGMVAVGTSKLMADMGGLPFTDTVFEFSNGNKLVITNDNFNTVYTAWVPFRQSFFTPST